LRFPEPQVVSARSLDKLASLLRARAQWKALGCEEAAAQLPSSGRLDWNRRDPLTSEVINASLVPISDVAACQTFIAFTAISRDCSTLGSPLVEVSTRIATALGVFAQKTGTSGSHARSGLYFLVPSLASQAGDLDLRTSAAAAMPLYVQCCNLILTVGNLPHHDAEAVQGLEVVDAEPAYQEREEKALGSSIAGCSDQAAIDRCNQVWEAAERMAQALPRKELPKFRSLVAEVSEAPKERLTVGGA